MRDVSCKLITKTLVDNDIGVQTEKVTKREIPIIRVEEVYSREFYEANEQGLKPCLRLCISALNYECESELEYMNVTYSILRAPEVSADEVVLVCERKIKNV